MSFTQHVMTCIDAEASGAPVREVHPGGALASCVAIVCTDDSTGAVVWVSHADSSIDPASRVNPSVPAKDYR